MAAAEQRSSEQMDAMRKRLQVWGDWLRQVEGVCGGAGLVARYDVRIGTPGQGLYLIPPNPEAEMVEAIMCRLKETMFSAYRALRLWYYVGMNNQQIADELRVSVATVKSWRLIGETAAASYWDAGYGKPEK